MSARSGQRVWLAKVLSIGTAVDEPRESKVAEFDNFVRADQDVSRRQVAVHVLSVSKELLERSKTSTHLSYKLSIVSSEHILKGINNKLIVNNNQ